MINDLTVFATQHPFLFWCSLWLVWAIVPIFTLSAALLNYLLRSLNIWFRGWPPEHLNANGNFRKVKKPEEVSDKGKVGDSEFKKQLHELEQRVLAAGGSVEKV